MKRTALGVAAVLLGGFSACGGGGTEVLVKGFRFQPSEVTVARGETVTWSQEDNTTHTITEDDAKLFDHRGFGRGERFSFTFEQTGAFDYHCAIHPEGMRGTVTVR